MITNLPYELYMNIVAPLRDGHINLRDDYYKIYSFFLVINDRIRNEYHLRDLCQKKVKPLLIRNGNLKRIKKHLTREEVITYTDFTSNDDICHYGTMTLVKKRLIDMFSSDSKNLFMIAVFTGQSEIVKYMIDKFDITLEECFIGLLFLNKKHPEMLDILSGKILKSLKEYNNGKPNEEKIKTNQLDNYCVKGRSKNIPSVVPLFINLIQIKCQEITKYFDTNLYENILTYCIFFTSIVKRDYHSKEEVENDIKYYNQYLFDQYKNKVLSLDFNSNFRLDDNLNSFNLIEWHLIFGMSIKKILKRFYNIDGSNISKLTKNYISDIKTNQYGIKYLNIYRQPDENKLVVIIIYKLILKLIKTNLFEKYCQTIKKERNLKELKKFHFIKLLIEEYQQEFNSYFSNNVLNSFLRANTTKKKYNNFDNESIILTSMLYMKDIDSLKTIIQRSNWTWYNSYKAPYSSLYYYQNIPKVINIKNHQMNTINLESISSTNYITFIYENAIDFYLYSLVSQYSCQNMLKSDPDPELHLFYDELKKIILSLPNIDKSALYLMEYKLIKDKIKDLNLKKHRELSNHFGKVKSRYNTQIKRNKNLYYKKFHIMENNYKKTGEINFNPELLT